MAVFGWNPFTFTATAIRPVKPMFNDPVDFPLKLIVYSDGPGPELRLTLEALAGANDGAGDIHVVLDWDPAEPDPADLTFGASCATPPCLHRHPEQHGFYPAVHAAINAIGPAHIGLIRQGSILSPAALASLVRGITQQGYAAVSPVTNRLAGLAIPLAPGDTPLTLSARLALGFGEGAIVPAPLLDLDVLLLAQTTLQVVPFPHFHNDPTDQSLVNFMLALSARRLPLGVCLDAYAYSLPRPGASPVMSADTDADTAAIARLAALVHPESERADLTARFTDFATAQAARRAQILAQRPILTAPATLCVLMSSLQLYGGVIVLVNWINQLILKGLDVRLYVQNPGQGPHPGLHLLCQPKPFAAYDAMARELPVGTRVVATFWTTAEAACELVWRIPRARGYYFIQDAEQRFYRDEGREAEHHRRAAASYRLPLTQIVTSRWIAGQIAESNPDAITRIPVGIDHSLFPPTPPAPAAPDRRFAPVLVAMARPETPRRGYDLLIATLALVYRRHPLIHIRLFGSKTLGDADLPFPCERLGVVDPPALRAIYRDADLFIDTSDFQGFGLAPLEAMALGCACVLTDSGGIAEYAQHGVNALIAPHDPTALATALCELIEHPSQRARLAAAAVETARRFDCARTTAGWLSVFQEEDRRADEIHAARLPPRGLVVIVPIYNQLEVVRSCIDSVLPTLGDSHHLLLVDDGSAPDTAAALDAYAQGHPRVTCLHNAVNLGFVGAANRGMAWAGERGHDMILLNSDTVVVPGWLDRLETAAVLNPEVGILSPLGTASSHLSLRLLPGHSVIDADRWLQREITPVYPTVITPEGWCFYIRHAVWRRLGGFDPIFGRGYCEESDYCLRALAIGWRLAVCDNLLIHHQGQATFGGQRDDRYRANRRIFDQRWDMIYQRHYRDFLAADPLGPLRARYQASGGQTLCLLAGEGRGDGAGLPPRCNLCGSTDFRPHGERPEWICAQCGSHDRTRLMGLYLSRLDLPADARILHLAPERGIYQALVARFGLDRYETADIDPSRYAFARNIRRLDLCQLDDLPSNHYDLILHSHVLEHTPCDIAYTLGHLHRALAPTGIHLCIIPFMGGVYDESFEDIGDDERTRRFGQFDHVRRFGRDDVDRHLGALLDFNPHFDATADFPPALLRQCNIAEAIWHGLSTKTVLVLPKQAYKGILG
ncbi:glycosyltransferase [Thiobaca trueperi]|uniref:GT2 family glycosyltransferase n=1 Tax=Thiobaca trueperi TaxID=127458 RepID=A0A4R3N2D2_9GAMM|nr:glycosyltransferase [Thiobaca trueperi]TCT22874.1 GT2 family glycosyltransferase [Thiobaca trueperi]